MNYMIAKRVINFRTKYNTEAQKIFMGILRRNINVVCKTKNSESLKSTVKPLKNDGEGLVGVVNFFNREN